MRKEDHYIHQTVFPHPHTLSTRLMYEQWILALNYDRPGKLSLPSLSGNSYEKVDCFIFFAYRAGQAVTRSIIIADRSNEGIGISNQLILSILSIRLLFKSDECEKMITMFTPTVFQHAPTLSIRLMMKQVNWIRDVWPLAPTMIDHGSSHFHHSPETDIKRWRSFNFFHLQQVKR